MNASIVLNEESLPMLTFDVGRATLDDVGKYEFTFILQDNYGANSEFELQYFIEYRFYKEGFKGVDVELVDQQANVEQTREEVQQVEEEKLEKEGLLPVEITLGEVNSNGVFLLNYNQKLEVPYAAIRNDRRYLRDQFLNNLLEINIEIF